MLNNKGLYPIEIQPTLYGDYGIMLEVPPITVEASSHRFIDIAEWAELGSEAFHEGNLKLFHTGKDLIIGAQIQITDEEKSLGFENKLGELEKFDSRRLDAVWWSPSKDAEMDVVLTNTSDEPLSVTAVLGRKPDILNTPQTINLIPHETKILNIRDDFNEGDIFARKKILGLSLKHGGQADALLAWAMIKDESNGYSNTAIFKNPFVAKSKQYHGAGLQLGKIGGDKLKPIVILRNISDEDIEVKIRVPYTKENGNKKKVKLDAITLASGEIHKVDMTKVRQLRDVKVAGIRIKHNKKAGSLITSVQSVSNSKNHVFKTLLWDTEAQKSPTGKYPFYIEDTTYTKAYIKNANNRSEEYISYISWESGAEEGMYMMGIKELGSNETAEIDFKKLRDEQIPDVEGRVIPINLTKGKFSWISRPKDEAGEDAPRRVPLVGQMQQVNEEKGINLTYFCQMCCGYNGTTIGVDGPRVEPGNPSLKFGESQQLQAYGVLSDCYGEGSEFPVTNLANWTSSNTDLVTVNNGMVTVVGVGEDNESEEENVEIRAEFHQTSSIPLTAPDFCHLSFEGEIIGFDELGFPFLQIPEIDENSNCQPCLNTSGTVDPKANLMVKKPKVQFPDIGSVEKGSVKTITVNTKNAPSNFETKLKFKNKTAARGSDRKWTTGEAKFVDSSDNDVVEFSYMGDQPQQIKIRGVERSSSKNNVKLEARFNTSSNVRKDKGFSVSSVEFIEEAKCTGFDDVEFQRTNVGTTRNFFVPRGGNNKLKARIVPSGATGNFKLTSNDAAITITPAVINSTSTRTFTVTGQAGVTSIRNKKIEAKANNTSSLTKEAETLNVDVLKRVNRNLVLYAVGEDNDDVQVIPKGTDGLPPSSICVRSGTNQFLDTKASSNDMEVADPLNPSLRAIAAGSNGKCNSEANDTDISAPSGLPSATSVQNYLNNIAWGRQANVYFNVSIGTSFEINFDLNRDKRLELNSSGESSETVKIRSNPAPSSGTYNYYFVNMNFHGTPTPTVRAVAPLNGQHAYFIKQALSDTTNVKRRNEGHEFGHLVGLFHSSSATTGIDFEDFKNDLMHGKTIPAIANNQCRIRKRDWDKANP